MILFINRFDCPTNWPSLVPDLVSALKAPQPLIQHRSLLIFHHVIKALASKRLIEDKRTFQVRYFSIYRTVLWNINYIWGKWYNSFFCKILKYIDFLHLPLCCSGVAVFCLFCKSIYIPFKRISILYLYLGHLSCIMTDSNSKYDCCGRLDPHSGLINYLHFLALLRTQSSSV